MILFAIAPVAFGLLALAWISYPAAMWLRAVRLIPHTSRETISGSVRGRYAVWTLTSQVRADLRPGA